jgi:hypothetical protein
VKEFPFTLPSGRKVVLRESTGSDELAAFRRCGTKTEEQEHQQYELVSSNLISCEGIPLELTGYERLMRLTSKDRQALSVLWNKINMPTAAEVKALRASVVKGKVESGNGQVGTSSFPLATCSFTLPCGAEVTMHQCTGTEEFAAQRAFIGKPEAESRLYRKWDELARCTIRIVPDRPSSPSPLSTKDEGRRTLGDCYSGFEELFALTSKALACLFIVFTDENTLSGEEVTGLRDFSPTGSPSLSSQS